MNKLKIKSKIHQSAKSYIKKKIAGIQKQMARLQNHQLITESKNFNLINNSVDEAAHELTDTLSKNLNYAKKELMVLEGQDGPKKLLDEVKPGAVVYTNRGTYYIAIATKNLVVHGMEVLGLSPNAPIYREMRKKEKGNTFVFRDFEYVIEDLY